MWIIISGCSLGSFGLTTSQLFHMACEQALHFDSRASGGSRSFLHFRLACVAQKVLCLSSFNTNISWQWNKIECLLTENQDPCEAVKCQRFSNPVAQTTNKKNNNQNSKVPRLLQKRQEWAHTFFLFRSFQSSDTLITFTAPTTLFLDHWSRLFCENIRNISTWKQKTLPVIDSMLINIYVAWNACDLHPEYFSAHVRSYVSAMTWGLKV